MIRILIVEDSNVVALLLKAIFEKAPDMEVIGRASDGAEAVELNNTLRPDLITMDIRMPLMDGFEATRNIMADRAIPIVVISASVDDEEMRTTFRAIEEGALAVIEKPRGVLHEDFDKISTNLIETVRAMSEVKVVRRVARQTQQQFTPQSRPVKRKDLAAIELIAIGSSTGGPQALQTILSSLPRDLAVPIAIAQHMSQGFLGGMVDWLKLNALLDIKVAVDGEPLKNGVVYFAPEDKNLNFIRSGGSIHASVMEPAPTDRFVPSATALISSATDVCGRGAVGVVLSGMGNDGAEGLLELKRAGGHTIIQDEKSSVVFGMPGSALALDAVEKIVELHLMAPYISSLLR